MAVAAPSGDKASVSLAMSDARAGLQALLRFVWSPTASALRLAEGCLATPAFVVLFVAAVWSGFCLVLQVAGHAPSFTVLPVPKAAYYGVQASLLPGLLVVGWLCLSWVAHLGMPGPWLRTARALALPYAGSILWLFVLPDIVGYIAFGFEGLGRVLRWTGPLLVFGAWLSSLGALRAVHAVSRLRAGLAALAGLVAQAVLLGPLLR